MVADNAAPARKPNVIASEAKQMVKIRAAAQHFKSSAAVCGPGSLTPLGPRLCKFRIFGRKRRLQIRRLLPRFARNDVLLRQLRQRCFAKRERAIDLPVADALMFGLGLKTKKRQYFPEAEPSRELPHNSYGQ